MGGNVQQALRMFALVIAAICLAAAPVCAQQPAAVPAAVQEGALGPTIVQSLGDAREDHVQTVMSVTGALLGAAGGVILVNVITGGAALTPMIGIPASNILGGSWLAATGALPLAGEMAVHTVTAATVAFGGGVLGMYFVRR